MKTKKDHKEETRPIDEEIAQVADIPVDQTAEVDSEELTEDGEDKLTLEDLEQVKAALEEMTTKAEEYLDGWQRSRAEFVNYKKRIAKENSEIHKYARGEVIKIYLDIVDDLERALLEKPETEEGKIWAEGIEIILQKLLKRLESEGVKPMDALGQEFDPNIHEALMKQESDEFESGQITEVLKQGYWIGDKVLRPALVRVAA
jgi:molecular chaperone GrpE